MATTIKQLIEYLQTLPEETEVRVIREFDGYYSHIEEVDLDLDPVIGNVDFVDLTGNRFVDSTNEHFNKKYLTLGEPGKL